jgi:hypothetical protein
VSEEGLTLHQRGVQRLVAKTILGVSSCLRGGGEGRLQSSLSESESVIGIRDAISGDLSDGVGGAEAHKCLGIFDESVERDGVRVGGCGGGNRGGRVNRSSGERSWRV